MKRMQPDIRVTSSMFNNRHENRLLEHALESLGLSLRYGEIHAVISNNPSEISRLWETLCLCQEQSGLSSRMFGLPEDSRPDNIRNEVFLLTPIFPTLSVFENVFMFEPSWYNQRRLLLKSQFKKLLKEYLIPVSVNDLPEDLDREQNLLLSLLRVYIHQPAIVFLPEGLDCFIGSGYVAPFERLITNIRANGTCVVFLTSQYEIAMVYSDRVSIVRDARILSTNITSAIQRYPHDFMNLYMGWELIGGQPGDRAIDLVSVAPDIKDIAFFNTDLKNTLQQVCSDILDITHSRACQIFLTDKKFKIHKTSSNKEEYTDYSIPEELAEQLLKHKNMYPFILNQQDADILRSQDSFSGCFVCVPIKAGHSTSTLILIEYGQKITLDERMKELLTSSAKKIAVSIEMSELIGRSSLVQESHHRIKNSLQTIVSLVTLEKERLIAEQLYDVVPVLTAIISRIKTIAVVHDLLSRQMAGNNLMDLAAILNRISESYRNMAILHFDLDNVIIPYNNALSISLVVNELLTNSVKHSMAESGTLAITVACHLKGDMIYLSVTDNGIGFPQDYETAAHSGIGHSIIETIVESLSGKIRYSYENGAKTEITFPQNTSYVI